MKQAVIFDLDGTLLNTLEDLTDSVNVILESYQQPKRTEREIRSFLGNGIRNLMACSVPNGEENPQFEGMLADFKEYYTAHCRIKTRPYDDILELLEQLQRKHIKMAIVSNKNHEAVVSLNELYFSDFISVAIGSREGIARKPAPDTVLEAMKELNVQPEEVIYVGDSEVDKMTAVNANVDCVLVDWGFRDREELEKLNPQAMISKPCELLEQFSHHAK